MSKVRGNMNTRKAAAWLERYVLREEGKPEVFQEIIALADREKNETLKCFALNMLMHFMCKTNSPMHEIEALLPAAFALHEQTGNNRLNAQTYRVAGILYHRKGELGVSIKNYLTAIEILEKIHHKDETIIRDLAGSYYNLSVLFNDEHELEKRLAYLSKAFDLFSSVNEMAGIALCYMSYGSYYTLRAEYEKALEYQWKGLDCNIKSKNSKRISVSYNNLGECYTNMGKYDDAVIFITKSIKLKKKYKAERTIASNYINLAHAYHCAKKYSQAKRHYEQAIDAAATNEVKILLRDAHKGLAHLLGDTGKYKQAYAHMNTYLKLKDELTNSEHSKLSMDIENKYRISQEKREAEWLRSKNREVEDYLRKLEITNNELREFAHVTAHDLTEPARMIKIYTELLKRSIADQARPEQQEYMQYISDGSSRMLDILSDLSELNGIETGADNKQVVDLNEVIAAVKENLKQRILQKQVRINCDHLPHVSAVRSQMIQLFQNLLENAIKYTRHEEPEIEITCSEYKNRAHLLCVQDNGIGVKPEYHDKIFELFQRLHSRAEFSGTGIGLSICKKIVERHGGKIWVESDGKRGAAFYLTLPSTD